jgi:Domain of unknown function (DUF4270)
MKKKHIIFKNIALLTIIFAGFVACDKEFVSIESDVVNSDNTGNFTTDKAIYPVITYSKKITAFQSNRLPAYLLGYNNDPVFGTSSSNFVAQMIPTAFDPSFGNNVVLDSVILTVPYFSTGIDTDEDGNITYRLDSVYGNAPIKLSVYQNNYFLRSFNPDSEFNDSQKYYSNGAISENNFINPAQFEGQLLYQDDSFSPSAEQIILTELDTEGIPVESGKLSPRIRVKLDNPNDTYWQELIFDKEGQPELSNQNNFINYFRGLYFKAEAIGIDGSLMQLNFSSSDANITIYYTSDTVTNGETDGEITQQDGTFVLNFSGNLINIFDNNFIPIPGGDSVNGDEKLYLKGGEGSMAIINIFNGDAQGNSTEFTQFKNDFKDGDVAKRLVNEAYLEFFVDQSIVQGNEPDRIYLYDIDNNTPLIDYFLDQSVSNLTINAKINHLEPLVRVDDDPNGEGIKYKIRITEHINNLIIRDSTNVKLGLVVTSNVGAIDPSSLLGENDKIIPSGTILSPKGTVLFGNNTTNEDKKVKLTIYYTEPDN